MLRTRTAGLLRQCLHYRDIPASEKPVFWREVQALAFLVLLPFFLFLGAVSRLLGRRRA